MMDCGLSEGGRRGWVLTTPFCFSFRYRLGQSSVRARQREVVAPGELSPAQTVLQETPRHDHQVRPGPQSASRPFITTKLAWKHHNLQLLITTDRTSQPFKRKPLS